MDMIDNLRLFQRLAERKSFSAVAQELGMTQPTVSRAIAALESRLGVSLFRRSSRGLSLTDEGSKLLNLGGPVLDQLDTVLTEVKNDKLLLQGRLKISASLAFARLILVPLLDEFLQHHPGLRLEFQLGDGRTDLVENGIDLAIRLGRMEDSALRAVKIGVWRRAVFASPDYLRRHGRPATMDDLEQHRLIYYTGVSDRPTWRFNAPDGSPKALHFQPYIQSDGSDLLREMVIAGLGVAYAPTWMFTEAERAGQVVRMLEPFCVERHGTYVLTVGARPLSAKQRALVDFLKVKFQNLPELRDDGA